MYRAGAALAVVAVLALGWFLWSRTAVDESATATTPAPVAAPQERLDADAPATQAATFVADTENNETPPQAIRTDEPRECWEIEELDEQGLPEWELELLYSVAPMGPDFENYRHLDQASVEAIAAQGDSAAMTLAGLMVMGDVYGVGPDAVFAMIVGDDASENMFDSLTTPATDPQVQARYEQASKWFYEAALHGRLGSLVLKGFVDTQMQRTAVDMGWVTADAFEELDAAGRTSLQPVIVYLGSVLQLAPGLAVGAFAEPPAVFVENDALINVVHEVMRRYHQDLTNRGLPRPAILDADLPAFSEVAENMCD